MGCVNQSPLQVENYPGIAGCLASLKYTLLH